MRTPATIARLRAIAAERRLLDEEEEQLLAELQGEHELEKAVVGSFVGIKEIARALNLSYDAARMRVSRADVGRQFGNATYAPREWLDAQLATVRSVRSLSEQRCADL